jgi:hypothetical protein
MSGSIEGVGSIVLSIFAAALSHVCVRHAAGVRRYGLLGLAVIALGFSFHFGRALGGLWVGIYTLVSIYFLACMTTPWLELAWRQRRDR